MKTIKNKCITVIITVFAILLPGNRSQGKNEHPVAKDIAVDGWKSLFDGETLTGWKVLRYGGNGAPHVRNGVMVIPRATTSTMTGVCWIGDSLPVNNYVICYEARRIDGRDIFAALTFPYGETAASLIFGGWGGIVNGLSSIGGYDASENETTQHFGYRNDQWYPVKLRVTTDSIRAVVGHEQIVDIATAGKDIHLRSEILDTGLTFWTYDSAGEIRNIRIKALP